MRYVRIIVGVALAAAVASRGVLAGELLAGKVVSVHDGDTITVLVDRRQVKVRLAGIDAPELGQAFGQAAKRHLSGLVFGKEVAVESAGLDRWGRTLGHVSVGGKPVAEAMISSGNAWHYVAFSTDKQLAAAESAAKAARKGLWSDPAPQPPWEWRKHEKARKRAPVAP